MTLKYFVLNILLCFLVLFLAFENYETWNHSILPSPDTGIAPEKSETKNGNPSLMATTEEPASIKPYNVIPAKNVFSPERKDFPVPAAAVADAQRPILRPQIVLYGVVITGDYESATVANPGRPLRTGEREAFVVKIGEKIGEYKLAKILEDRIAMEGNGDTFEVLLYDPKNPKKRMEARAEPKPVMTASPQPALVPVPPLDEPPETTPSQGPVEKPKERVQAQVLPFNKYTYQLLGPSASISRGKIVSPAPGPSTQKSPKS
ncbi:MAG: hypothetical protein WCO26_21730 [Deltaproteobacteria bacterium]